MLVCLVRSIILYLLLLLVIRLMGKRQIGEMGPSEFVVAMLIADLASVPMQDLGIPLLSGVVPILTVLAIELLLSALSFRFIFVRKLFNGIPVILIENGKLLPESLKKTRLTPDELTEHLRDKGILDLSTVQYAILETNGQISAIQKSEYLPPDAQFWEYTPQIQELPWTIISCGKLMHQNLRLSGKNKQWLDQLLRTHQCTVPQVMLLSVTDSGKVYLSVCKENS